MTFPSSCQYTHGVARRLLGPHDTLSCVLIWTDVKNTLQLDSYIHMHIMGELAGISIYWVPFRKLIKSWSVLTPLDSVFVEYNMLVRPQKVFHPP